MQVNLSEENGSVTQGGNDREADRADRQRKLREAVANILWETRGRMGDGSEAPDADRLVGYWWEYDLPPEVGRWLAGEEDSWLTVALALRRAFGLPVFS